MKSGYGGQGRETWTGGCRANDLHRNESRDHYRGLLCRLSACGLCGRDKPCFGGRAGAFGRGLEGAVWRILSPFSSLAETYADDTKRVQPHGQKKGIISQQKDPEYVFVLHLLTDVLLVRLLQEEGLQSSCCLLYQSVDDLVKVSTGDLEKETCFMTCRKLFVFYISSSNNVHAPIQYSGFVYAPLLLKGTDLSFCFPFLYCVIKVLLHVKRSWKSKRSKLDQQQLLCPTGNTGPEMPRQQSPL